ncbi:TonB-dependent receptor [Exilibacterium tricleocarpae]|uniref:TonB-dependent receptor n=1 Tax=Exilibacterium tricleocarpae TaxID=2591008 RepID=A0A545TFG6_9GAMM|nr:TonB-dependent receptor [Exilibacterium tricleocarpae]TQV75963.1 TonB-dependent receptor [Exilibacterium tricleocarpae]
MREKKINQLSCDLHRRGSAKVGRHHPKLLSIGVMSSIITVAPVLAQSPGTDSEVDILEEVIVTGHRASMQSAQDFKRDAEQIVDSIKADDIGNLPDRSVAEALQRVPGVTIDRFISVDDPEHVGGEGGGVAVRGLTQVRSEINGRDGFTANGGRSLSFEDVPPELLSAVDVYKNPSADMIEGGLGGTVDLRTRMPFDSESQLATGTLVYSHNNLIEENSPEASFLFSDRWQTGFGEIGFLVDIAYSESKGRVDTIFTRPYFPYDRDGDGVDESFVPRGADWRTVRTDRAREGAYLAFQWRPSGNMEYYATVFRSEYDYNWDEDAFFVQNDPTNLVASDDSVFDSNGTFVRGTLTDPTEGGIPMGSTIRFSERNSKTTDFAIGFNAAFADNWSINADLQYVEATTVGLDSTVATGVLSPFSTIDLSGSGPVEVITDTDYLADLNNYHFAFTMDHQDDNEADQLALRVDVEYTFDDSVLKTFEFGLRHSERDSIVIDTGFNWKPVIQPWMRGWALDGAAPLPTLADFGLQDQVRVNRFSNFYRGDIPVPGAIVAPTRALAEGYPQSYVSLHQAATPFYLCCFSDGSTTFFSPTLVEPSHRNVQDETVESLYFLARFGWDEIGLGGNIGVRFVHTKNIASGFIQYTAPVDAPPSIQEIIGSEDDAIGVKNNYRNTLPSLNLRWEIREGLIGRFAYAKAMRRPDFSTMQSYLNLSASLNAGAPEGSLDINDYSGTAEGGNPNLRPLEAEQFDLSLEYYYSDIGSVWLNFFQKDIDGFIRNEVMIETYNNFDYAVTRPTNQDEAKIDGWEAGWKHFFDFGIGIEASYTRIDSETQSSGVNIPVDTDGTAFDPNGLPYEGLSEASYSTVFIYENQRLSTRLAYTWRDEFLLSVGPNSFNDNTDGIAWQLPVFQEAYGQWDGSIVYKFSENFSVGLQANNLTNEEIVIEGRQINPGRNAKSYSVQDTRYALTLRGTF